MENKSITLLEKIKDGSILKELTEYEKLQITNHQRKILDYAINLNERCRFPRNEDTNSDFGYSYFNHPFLCLINKGLVFDPTIPELVGVFSKNSITRNLPKELNYATWNGRYNFMHGHKGSTKSWDKKIESSRARSYTRYHIALISKEQVPTFKSAFAFLDYLKPMLESK